MKIALQTALIAAVFAVASTAQAQVINLPQPRGGGVVGTTPDVQTLNTGVNMHIGGVAVSADHRYVGVNIGLQQAILDGFDIFTGSGTAIPSGLLPAGATGGSIGSVTFLGNSNTLLGQKTSAIKSDAMSLRDAVKKIAGETNSNVVLSTNALKAAKIDPASTHKLDVPAGAMRDSLTALLEQTVPGVPMVIKADSEVVYVTTRAHADNELVSKSYALEGLVVRLTRFVPKETDLSRIRPADAPTATTTSPLCEVITKNIRPEVWKINGGKGEVTQTGNRVIILAPASVHAQIAIPAVVVKAPERPGYIGYGN